MDARDLAIARHLRGLTQQQVALVAGLNPVVLCYYERGKRHPKREVVERILQAIEKLAEGGDER
jgi:transcriptional regulator with XRE-family HTH domain